MFSSLTTNHARLKPILSWWTRAVSRPSVVCFCRPSSGTSTLVSSLRASCYLRQTGPFTDSGRTFGGFDCIAPLSASYWLTFLDSNGSYTQYCDLNRQYDPVPSPNTTTGLPNGTVVPAYNGSGIGTFLEPFGRYDLLDYMNTYWIAQNSPNQDLWGVS